MKMLCADFEGDSYSGITPLYVAIGPSGRGLISSQPYGDHVNSEQALIDIINTHVMFVSDTQCWSLLRVMYPEAYRLVTGQLESMIVASPWWSPVHVLNLYAKRIPLHARYIVLTDWLANTNEPSRGRMFVKLVKKVNYVKRFTSRREA